MHTGTRVTGARLGGAGRRGAICVCSGTSSSPQPHMARAPGAWGTSRLALWLRPASRRSATRSERRRFRQCASHPAGPAPSKVPVSVPRGPSADPQQDPCCCKDALNTCVAGGGGPEDTCRPEDPFPGGPVPSPQWLCHRLTRCWQWGREQLNAFRVTPHSCSARRSHRTLNYPVHFSRSSNARIRSARFPVAFPRRRLSG